MISMGIKVGRQQCSVYFKRKHRDGGGGETCSKTPKCPLKFRAGVDLWRCPLGLTETSLVGAGSTICVHGPLQGVSA